MNPAQRIAVECDLLGGLNHEEIAALRSVAPADVLRVSNEYQEQKARETFAGLLVAGAVSGLLAGGLVLLVLSAHLEARSHNRLTGGNATTWQALFRSLPVEGGLR